MLNPGLKVCQGKRTQPTSEQIHLLLLVNSITAPPQHWRNFSVLHNFSPGLHPCTSPGVRGNAFCHWKPWDSWTYSLPCQHMLYNWEFRLAEPTFRKSWKHSTRLPTASLHSLMLEQSGSYSEDWEKCQFKIFLRGFGTSYLAQCLHCKLISSSADTFSIYNTFLCDIGADFFLPKY